MSELELGVLVAVLTVFLLLLGAPVAFVLGSVAIVFLVKLFRGVVPSQDGPLIWQSP